MTTSRACFAALLLCAALVADAVAAESTAQRAPLDWLAGSWESEVAGIHVEEHWTTQVGGVLLGVNRTTRAARTIEFEYLRIEQGADGRVCYFASPQGGDTAVFCGAVASEQKLVVERQVADGEESASLFPWRISYWLDDAGMLHARIEAREDHGIPSREWVWRRSKGPGTKN